MRTLVIGLGNPILTDDGVGILVARAVQQRLAEQPAGQVDVAEASVGGLRLMEMMVGYDQVILIDALLDRNATPGAVQCWTLEQLSQRMPTQHLASAHDANLPTALAAGRRMGLSLPDDVVVIAIAAQNVLEFNEQPTPAVAAAVPEATAAAMAMLR